MKKHTLNQKRNGELATRLLSNKAQKFYEITDPIEIWKINENLYDIDICGDTRENITLQDIEKIFEEMFDEYCKEIENDVRLSNSERNNDFKIEANYNANVLFETSVAVNGQSYLVIYGEHINGNFCCIPGYGWGCEMAEPSDVFYNSRSLSNCGAPGEIAQALAKAIEERSKEPDLSHEALTTSLVERALAEQLKADAKNRVEANQNRLSVLYVEPNKPPRTIKIDNSLEAMQALVGGKIEEYAPFSDKAVFVCNRESRIKHLPFNRAIYDENDKGTRQLIFGSFFICYAPPESENLLSLPSELEEKYSKMFKYPERFYIADNKVKIEKVKPTRTSPELI